MHKKCKECGETKSVEDFPKAHVSNTGHQIYKARCKPCHNALEAHKWANVSEERKRKRLIKSKERFDSDYHKNYRLGIKYGLTLEQFNEMYATQEGKCDICGDETPSNVIRVDHNHKTGKVRSLLCHQCNVGLGHFKESPELLTKAIAYLEEHSHYLLQDT